MKDIFDTPISVKFTLDEIILIITALDHHRIICNAAGDANEASHYQPIIDRLEQASLPAITRLAQANDHLSRGL